MPFCCKNTLNEAGNDKSAKSSTVKDQIVPLIDFVFCYICIENQCLSNKYYIYEIFNLFNYE